MYRYCKVRKFLQKMGDHLANFVWVQGPSTSLCSTWVSFLDPCYYFVPRTAQKSTDQAPNGKHKTAPSFGNTALHLHWSLIELDPSTFIFTSLLNSIAWIHAELLLFNPVIYIKQDSFWGNTSTCIRCRIPKETHFAVSRKHSLKIFIKSVLITGLVIFSGGRSLSP